MNRIRKNIAIVVLSLIVIGFSSRAQDVQFSQFYSVPTFQNPAFVGAAHFDKFTLHQRIQWPSLKAKYLTSFASYDTYFKQYRSGFGAYIIHDRVGSGSIVSNEIQLQYAYEMNLSSQWVVRFGLQLGYVSRRLDGDLTFPGQYDDDGFLGGNSPVEGINAKNYFDASSGAIIYSNNFWAGLSSNHMNRPNTSFLDNYEPLPIRWTFVTGYRFDIVKKDDGLAKSGDFSKVITITPTAHYKFQGKSDQVDLGLYIQYHQAIIGGWYRGIPFKTFEGFQNNESVVLLAGYKFPRISVTYSYDWVTSTLNEVRTFGAHEINLTYVLRPMPKSKPTKRMPCPKFYVH